LFYDILQKGPAMPEGSIFPDPQNDPFFNRLPSPDSKEQRHPIAAALPGYGMAKPPVNTRLSIPIPRWRFYLSISSGEERRRKPHLAADRRHNPLSTKGDALFVLMGDDTFSFYPRPPFSLRIRPAGLTPRTTAFKRSGYLINRRSLL
jgi:hypothetical protein